MEVAAKHHKHIGSDEEGKHKWLVGQQAYATARAEAGGVHLRLAAQGEHRGGFETCGPGAMSLTTTT